MQPRQDGARHCKTPTVGALLAWRSYGGDAAQEISKQCPKLRYLVVMGPHFASTVVEGHIKVISFDDVINVGKEVLKNGKPTVDRLCICVL